MAFWNCASPCNFRILRGGLLATLLLSSATSLKTLAGDWPQILGPHRNGTADGESVQPWADSGPPLLWTHSLGQGYAGPAVKAGRVVVFHRVNDVERIEALNGDTGRVLWKTDFAARYRGGVDPDVGPRCVPVIHADRVYAFGAAGDLHCLDLATGTERWSRSLHKDFSALEGYFGAGSSPIIVGESLLVNVGGRDQAGLVALDARSGRTLWKRTDERASYSSPVETRLGDRSCVIFVTRFNVVGVSPGDGAEQFRFGFGRRGPTVNAATPLVFDDSLFVTANYGVGARLVRLAEPEATPVWGNDESLSSQYPTPVYYEGNLYGIHGREDLGVADLRCVAAETGNVLWSRSGFGMAHLIRVGSRLLILGVDGRLVLAAASADKFRQLAEASLCQGVTRALPALSDGRLFVRENKGRTGSLRCFQLAERAESASR